jgi:hypothetical protein
MLIFDVEEWNIAKKQFIPKYLEEINDFSPFVKTRLFQDF